MSEKAIKNKKISYDSVSSILYPVLFGILIFVLWENGVLNTLLNTDTNILPAPSRIAGIVSENSAKISENLTATMTVILWGLICGSLFGYLTAVFATRFQNFGKGALTVLSVFNAIPIVALAPVFNNWTKDVSSEASVRSTVAKILVVTVVCAASMSINAYRGLTELKPFSLDLMKSYAADNITIFKKLRFHNSIPYIFTALKVSVPSSVITALVSEYFAEYRMGIGRQIRDNISIAQYSAGWAYIVVACIIGIFMYMVLMIIEGIAAKQHR